MRHSKLVGRHLGGTLTLGLGNQLAALKSVMINKRALLNSPSVGTPMNLCLCRGTGTGVE